MLPPQPPCAQPPREHFCARQPARLPSTTHHSGLPPQPWPHPLSLLCRCLQLSNPACVLVNPRRVRRAAPPGRAPGWLLIPVRGATWHHEFHRPSTDPWKFLPLLVLPTAVNATPVAWTKPQSHPQVLPLPPIHFFKKPTCEEPGCSHPPRLVWTVQEAPSHSPAPTSAPRPLLLKADQHTGLCHTPARNHGLPTTGGVGSKLPIVAATAPFDLTPEISTSPQTTSPCAHSPQPRWPRCRFLNVPSGTPTIAIPSAYNILLLVLVWLTLPLPAVLHPDVTPMRRAPPRPFPNLSFFPPFSAANVKLLTLTTNNY